MRYNLLWVILLAPCIMASAQTDTLIIHFDLNKVAIRVADSAVLDSLAAGIKGISSIMLAGHADSIGNDRVNDSLSAARAQATAKYLMTRGVPDSLFRSVEGY